jgi:hypothetical protein
MAKSRRERRDVSPAGDWNRSRFETSMKLLHVIGLSANAIDFCQRRARETQRLPHEILRELFEDTIAASSSADLTEWNKE